MTFLRIRFLKIADACVLIILTCLFIILKEQNFGKALFLRRSNFKIYLANSELVRNVIIKL